MRSTRTGAQREETVTTAVLSPLDIFQATAILLSDRPPGKVDAIFFHARPRGDDDECFELAAEYLRTERAQFVVINGSCGEAYGKTTPGEAWEGADAYERRLRDLHVPPEALIRSRPAFHTRDEADAFYTVARGREWKSAAVLTLPHHITRAMLSMVHVALAQCPLQYPRVYALAPTTVNWWKQVPGSQGHAWKRRSDHIAGELERIARYQVSGELATLQELSEYLDWRDD